jgi:arylsulfatase A-like enzyme
MKKLISSLFFVYFLLGAMPMWSQGSQKPNVIVIYTDDQGAVDLGSYGAKDIFTPNLDQLAKEGTRFTQAYVAAPVCAPSRAALLTGNYPQRAGVTGNTSAKPGSHGLPSEQYTMAELFKDHGYATGHIGKWHLGMSEESGPNAQGFDYSFGHLRGCIDNYSHYFFWNGPNIHDLYENGKEVFYDGQYFPDLMAEKAEQFVTQHQGSPFFMYYAINMPHYPYQPTQKWRDHYKDVPKPRGDYAAFISTIDERIGFLLDTLDKLGIRENTIIVYQSDNGYSTEVRAFNGGGDSGPYRGAKSSLFEGGIRLPTIISWKGNLPENITSNEMLLNTDWMPTLSSLCGFTPDKRSVDGIDLSQNLKDPALQSPRTTTFWKYGNQWAVRQGKWKLIAYPKDTSHKGVLDLEQDALFLSDMDTDVSEMKNLALQYPDKVEMLTNLYTNWEFGSSEDVPKKIETVSHLGIQGSIVNTLDLHKKYTNIEVLLDGKRGYLDYSSGQWIGQEEKDLEFIIDLKEPASLSKISCGFLHDPGDWIFNPILLEISGSLDGKSFTNVGQVSKAIGPSTEKSFSDLLTMNESFTSRYVKVRIKNTGKCPDDHKGAGNKAWIFIDEIIIE